MCYTRQPGNAPFLKRAERRLKMGTALAVIPAASAAIKVPSFSEIRRAHYDFSKDLETDDPELDALLLQATEYALNSRSKGTRDNYDSAWNAQIIPFCKRFKCLPYPMKVRHVAALFVYVISNDRALGSERTPSYLGMVRNTLSIVHRMQGLPDPTAAPENLVVYQGLVRKFGLKPKHPKIAIYPEEVAQMMITALSDVNRPRSFLKRAVLGLGSAGAMRCAEVNALNVENCAFDRGGMTVTIKKSKTDQEQIGREIYIQRSRSQQSDPVRAVQEYFDQLKAKSGPAFRTVLQSGRFSDTRACTRTLRRLVKECSAELPVDVAEVGFHSLRAGFITSGMDSDIKIHILMEMTGHATIDSLLYYYRPRFRRAPNLSEAVGM
jgi:integrase